MRVLTYLAPSLPQAIFEHAAAHLGAALRTPVELLLDTRVSGPEPGGHDPFGAGEADVGFMCAPPFVWLRERSPSSVELCPAALLFDDPRLAGAPRYFADVIVSGAASAARVLDDLRGAASVTTTCAPCRGGAA